MSIIALAFVCGGASFVGACLGQLVAMAVGVRRMHNMLGIERAERAVRIAGAQNVVTLRRRGYGHVEELTK